MLDYTLITSQLNDMQTDLRNSEVLTKEGYQSKYYYLSKNVPTLFELLYKNNDIDIEQLKFMISQAQKINNNEISQYDADVIIGQKLADSYITPVIGSSEPTVTEEIPEN